MRVLSVFLAVAGAFVASTACQLDRPPRASSFPPADPVSGRNMTETVVARYEPGFDYFPHKVGFRHSNQLAAEYHGHYKRVRLVTNGVGEEFRFVFVQRGTPAPRVEPDDVVIHVPIERFSLGSYRYGGASDVLGVVDRIVGFGNHTHVTTPSIQRLFETGRLQRNFDLEAIANRGTEAHFNWYATSSLSAVDDAVERMGSLVIPAAEHMEPTTLARAEWVKFFAMFFNKEAEANALFDDIERRYRDAAALVRDVGRRPIVFVNLPLGGAWNIYGGRNQLSRIFADAGAEYVWSDNPSPESGTTTHYELALDRGLEADVWLMGAEASFGARIANLSLANPRFAAFKAVRSGRVYINHRNYPHGPNPWWDQALIKPHEELADLIAIIHPERLPNRELVFYRRLETSLEAAGGTN
jgi:iron complex transport system substrate-binding protein